MIPSLGDKHASVRQLPETDFSAEVSNGGKRYTFDYALTQERIGPVFSGVQPNGLRQGCQFYTHKLT